MSMTPRLHIGRTHLQFAGKVLKRLFRGHGLLGTSRHRLHLCYNLDNRVLSRSGLTNELHARMDLLGPRARCAVAW